MARGNAIDDIDGDYLQRIEVAGQQYPADLKISGDDWMTGGYEKLHLPAIFVGDEHELFAMIDKVGGG